MTQPPQTARQAARELKDRRRRRLQAWITLVFVICASYKTYAALTAAALSRVPEGTRHGICDSCAWTSYDTLHLIGAVAGIPALVGAVFGGWALIVVLVRTTSLPGPLIGLIALLGGVFTLPILILGLVIAV
ncbi:hypothetical protein ACX8Z7_12865 [Glutamicibacter endophyticus]